MGVIKIKSKVGLGFEHWSIRVLEIGDSNGRAFGCNHCMGVDPSPSCQVVALAKTDDGRG